MSRTRDTKIIEALNKAIAETFEGLTFSEVCEISELDAQPQFPNETFASYIDMPEPIALRFTLVFGKDHGREIFETVCPMLDELEEAILIDFLKEVTNTAAGHFHTNMHPEDDDMKIGLPETLEPSAYSTALEPSHAVLVNRYDIEGNQIIAAIGEIPE